MLSNFKVLFVEDNQETLENISEILKNRVKELYLAKDGMEGIELYNKYNPDIILTDINMPKLNGIDMSRKLKNINEDIPIIILTAFDENRLLHKSLEIGVDAYITKPIIEIKQLIKPLEKVALNLQSKIDKQHLEFTLKNQNKLAAMGEMIGNIAHQWRQPLSIITTTVSAMKLKSEMNCLGKDDVDKCVQEVLSQSNYLSETIDNFRNFIKRGNTVNKIKISLLLDKTHSLISASLNNNYITLIEDIKDDLEVMADLNQLTEALINILSNSKQAFIDDEKVDKYIFVSTKKLDEQTLQLEILDNAGGIKEEIINRVFEPYFTTKHQSIGTGLGLTLVDKILREKYDFDVSLENKEFEYLDKTYKGLSFKIIFKNNIKQ